MGSSEKKTRYPNVLVDADACPVPVRRLIERTASRHQLRLVFFTDENHELFPEYGEVRRVAQGHDAVDYALLSKVSPGDIVVTQDYGLAALVMSRRAYVIHPSGMIYSSHNIDQLLMERHLAGRARMAGERIRSSKKKSGKNDLKFADQLTILLNRALAESQG